MDVTREKKKSNTKSLNCLNQKKQLNIYEENNQERELKIITYSFY